MLLEIALSFRQGIQLRKASAHSDPYCKTVNPSAKPWHKLFCPKRFLKRRKSVRLNTRHGYFFFLGLPGGRAPHSTRFVRSLPVKGIFDGDDGQASLREGRCWGFPPRATSPSR